MKAPLGEPEGLRKTDFHRLSHTLWKSRKNPGSHAEKSSFGCAKWRSDRHFDVVTEEMSYLCYIYVVPDRDNFVRKRHFPRLGDKISPQLVENCVEKSPFPLKNMGKIRAIREKMIVA
jgi:hypothetical protein